MGRVRISLQEINVSSCNVPKSDGNTTRVWVSARVRVHGVRVKCWMYFGVLLFCEMFTLFICCLFICSSLLY